MSEKGSNAPAPADRPRRETSGDETPQSDPHGASDQGGAAPSEPDQVDRRFLECLVCPRTQGPLHYDPQAMELISRKARLVFPIRSGVPILLESEARALQDGE